MHKFYERLLAVFIKDPDKICSFQVSNPCPVWVTIAYVRDRDHIGAITVIFPNIINCRCLHISDYIVARSPGAGYMVLAICFIAAINDVIAIDQTIFIFIHCAVANLGRRADSFPVAVRKFAAVYIITVNHTITIIILSVIAACLFCFLSSGRRAVQLITITPCCLYLKCIVCTSAYMPSGRC